MELAGDLMTRVVMAQSWERRTDGCSSFRHDSL